MKERSKRHNKVYTLTPSYSKPNVVWESCRWNAFIGKQRDFVFGSFGNSKLVPKCCLVMPFHLFSTLYNCPDLKEYLKSHGAVFFCACLAECIQWTSRSEQGRCWNSNLWGVKSTKSPRGTCASLYPPWTERLVTTVVQKVKLTECILLLCPLICLLYREKELGSLPLSVPSRLLTWWKQH